MKFLMIFFLYLFAHCIADTALQTDAMAKGKNKNREIDLSRVPKGQKAMNLWYMWLTHHSVIQAGCVFFVSYFLMRNLYISFAFAMIELFSHWIIDFNKCNNNLNPISDQLWHLVFKLIYTVDIVYYL
jgi:hypothetical protein